MPKGDEDGEDDEAIAAQVARYPCMPSLVALQQMRNRLQLAYVGKKLMKWTAMATGKELRKIAIQLSANYDTFRDDMIEAFMLLARSRFYSPNLNPIVLENVGDVAAVKVGIITKTVSGVKVLHMEILDSNLDPYAHLGLQAGGQIITQAKHAWRDLLKRLILMMEDRISFVQVDMANKTATKRQNALAKLVIPRSLATIRYILQQMEEFSREEFYRMKMILAIKRKKVKPKKEVSNACPICLRTKARREGRKCIFCGKSLEGISTTPSKGIIEDAAKIQEFKKHLDDIVDISKTIEGKGVEKDVEEFIKTAEVLKEKLSENMLRDMPEDVPVETLCDLCKERVDREQEERGEKNRLITKISVNGSTSNVTETKESDTTIKSIKTMEHLCSKHSDLGDFILGVFEIETEEITKIVRVKNADGTVSEEKKVIKLKKEKRIPLSEEPQLNEKLSKTSAEDDKENNSGEHPTIPICHSILNLEQCSCSTNNDSNSKLPETPSKSKKGSKKTIGMVTVNSNGKTFWRAHSATGGSAQQIDPIIKSCISSASFLTYSTLTDNISSGEDTSIINKKDLIQPCTKFEEVLELHEYLNNKTEEITTKGIYKNDSLTYSENELLGKLIDCKLATKSELRNDVKVPYQKTELKNSISLDTNNYVSNNMNRVKSNNSGA